MFDFSDIFLYCIGIMIGSLFVRKVKDQQSYFALTVKRSQLKYTVHLNGKNDKHQNEKLKIKFKKYEMHIKII